MYIVEDRFLKIEQYGFTKWAKKYKKNLQIMQIAGEK